MDHGLESLCSFFYMFAYVEIAHPMGSWDCTDKISVTNLALLAEANLSSVHQLYL
jgi:hypothetical protein